MFVTIAVTHLSSQRYSICVRQPTGTTNICYIPCTNPNADPVVANTQVCKKRISMYFKDKRKNIMFYSSSK